MPVQFDSIEKGSEWDRNELAELWGYQSRHALARGVFTPAGQATIVLFVTEEKQESLTQYDDRLIGKTLYWEGENGHQNDARIVNATDRNDRIQVFYRKQHHRPFEYIGQAQLTTFKLLSDKPSEFVFEIV